MMAYLVKMGFVKEVWMSFLVVGHTHEDVDQCFSRISSKLKPSNCRTIDELHSIIQSSQLPTPKSANIEKVWNISKWLEPYVQQVHNVTFPKLYRIFNDSTGHTTIQFKKLSTDDQWHPSPGEKPLEIFKLQNGLQVAPEGIPEVVAQQFDEDDMRCLQRSMEKDFQLAQFGEEEIQCWRNYFENPIMISDNSQWPLNNMTMCSETQNHSSLSDKEKQLLEAYKAKRQEFKMVHTSSKGGDRREYTVGNYIIYFTEKERGAVSVGKVNASGQYDITIQKCKVSGMKGITLLNDTVSIPMSECFPGAFKLTNQGHLPKQMKERKFCLGVSQVWRGVMSLNSILPYTCVYIDADWKDIFRAAGRCLKCSKSRDKLLADLKVMWSIPTNQNQVLPCLSVRTGFDLYLQVKSYPPGSEVIMSAINIPDMVHIVRQHGLKIIPWDVDIERTSPKLDLLETLINDKTVAIIVAHIFGKWVDVDPIINIAHKYKLAVIEDCAESFCGFENLGNPRCDLSLFSFGVIKYYTSFGGAIAKVKDENVYAAMCELNTKYPVQQRREYLKKLVKYFMVYLVLDCPNIIKPAMFFTRTFNIDHKRIVIKMLRGFPDQLMKKIRQQPSTPLLQTMWDRLSKFSHVEFGTSQIKGEYVRQRLPDSVTMVGSETEVNNYWLYPVLVENPDNVVKILNAMGIDAYRGATQLNIIEPEKWNPHLDFFAPLTSSYPHEARYLIDHVVYLPVNKSVPFHVLDHICQAVNLAMKMSTNGQSVSVRRQSKL